MEAHPAGKNPAAFAPPSGGGVPAPPPSNKAYAPDAVTMTPRKSVNVTVVAVIAVVCLHVGVGLTVVIMHLR
jgi:hypothetical protein